MLEKSVSGRSPVAVSSISIWEIAMLVEHKRLELSIPVGTWLAHLEDVPWLSFVPVDNRIAVRAVQLNQFPHHDPADRIIVATTLGLNATLVTGDKRLRAYSPLRSAWD
jgi:PIN domain nuclease of toxin-antitoxin system